MLQISSFSDFLRASAPELLPGGRSLPEGQHLSADQQPRHGTTIVAATYPGGVVLAGDRRATAGSMIASRDIEKVFPTDMFSAIGIAGTAGLAIEMVRLFCVELEHYEKIEGTPLSLEGKANRLASMIRGNLGVAMQGLAVVPLFVGYDLDADLAAGDEAGRIYSYDIAGGVYPEEQFHAVGSGSLFAKSAMKKRYAPGLTADETVDLCLEALYDAADDDTGTGGPDLIRKIFPIVLVVEADGVRRLSEDAVGTRVQGIVERRVNHPGG
jgi:proteasome beta subunit